MEMLSLLPLVAREDVWENEKAESVLSSAKSSQGFHTIED